MNPCERAEKPTKIDGAHIKGIEVNLSCLVTYFKSLIALKENLYFFFIFTSSSSVLIKLLNYLYENELGRERLEIYLKMSRGKVSHVSK